MTIYMWIATAAWVCLVAGYVQRRQRNLHVLLMRSAIFTDVTLVLYLQITRGAIQTALSFDLEILKQLHIGASSIALLLYVPVLVLGNKLLKGRGDEATRTLHIRIALTAFVFRTIGFVLMFSMLQPRS